MSYQERQVPQGGYFSVLIMIPKQEFSQMQAILRNQVNLVKVYKQLRVTKMKI